MGTQAMNTYGFEYDKLGRLKNTLHYIAVATTPTNSYTERGITYDLNGNITTLKRYAASEATPEDDYQYIYTGNKLMQITATENNADISNALYVYDQNGNMIQDGLKNLQISYNFLNLPSVVTQDDTPVAEYSWFADGSKYRVLTQQNNGYIYTGSLIYASNNGNLQIESTDFAGGRINLVENTSTNALSQDIHYFHTDHLGSVRAITDNSGSVIEQNAYYPFGSRHTFGNTYAQTTNRFKFNGKEEQTTGNLNYLDYGARMYDSNIGRWMVQNPLAEQMYMVTPYRFSLNNPVNFIDPDGLFETRREARRYRREYDTGGHVEKNEDGTLKNRTITISSVSTTTDVSGATGSLWYTIDNNNITRVNLGVFTFNEDLNYFVNSNGQRFGFVIVDENSYRTNGRTTSFNPKQAFRAVDYSDTEYIANQAMPSDRYVDLTLGASGTAYTAPADGYIKITKNATTAGQYIDIYTTDMGVGTLVTAYGAQALRCFCPVAKGDRVTVSYTAAGTTGTFRFVFANGAK